MGGRDSGNPVSVFQGGGGVELIARRLRPGEGRPEDPEPETLRCLGWPDRGLIGRWFLMAHRRDSGVEMRWEGASLEEVNDD